MRRLIRIAGLQVCVLVLHGLLALPENGLWGLPGSVVGLDLAILVFAVWLRFAGPWRYGPTGFWGPWPPFWVQMRLLGDFARFSKGREGRPHDSETALRFLWE